MDFDHLSSRWQQQAPLTIPQTAEDFRALLAEQSKSPVTQMRQNIWFEIGTTVVVATLVLALLYGIRDTRLGQLLIWLLPLYGGIAYCYFGIVGVLRGLQTATDALASHVARQLRQLRQLMWLYYGATMLSTLAVLGVLSYLAIQYVLPHVPRTGQTKALTWIILTAIISAGVTHWFCRYHIQNFYGQHLDRLEQVLQELKEDEAAA